MASIPDFHAVIPAGGAGTRLWPLSRAAHPKFLLDLTCPGRSRSQQTGDRLARLTGTAASVVGAGSKHADAVHNQLPARARRNLWIEPGPCDSMAGIGLAAALLAHRVGPG